MKKKVMVTGGAGFIGSHIACRLISEGFDVLVLDNLSTGKLENIPKKADFIKLDLGKKASYGRLKGIACDAVFHLAGQSSGEASFDDPFYDLTSHIMSTFWLLDWCKAKSVGRFLYASSMSVYGDPEYLPVDEAVPLRPKTFYGAGKVSAESYINLYQTLGIDTTIFRLFSVYGPGQNLDNRKQGMVSIYLSYMLEGAPITVKGDKNRFRDFIYIDDVVDAWLAAWNNPVACGKIYNVATGRKTTVEELLKALSDAFEREDYPATYGGSTPGDQFGAVADIARIEKDLKWAPRIEIRAGIDKMVKFEKNRGRDEARREVPAL